MEARRLLQEKCDSTILPPLQNFIELKQDVESGKRVLTEPEKALINSLIDEMNKSNNTSGEFDFNNYMYSYNPVLDTFIEMFGNGKINANIPPLNQTTSTESVPSVPTNSVKGGKRMRYTKQMKKTRRKRQSGRSTRCSKRTVKNIITPLQRRG